MSRKIVITSGKGGVGKTTVAANLGARLGAAGKRVCVVDLDMGLNNLDVVTGVENLVVYDLVDCLEGRCRAKQAIVECPSAKNAFVLPCVRSPSGGKIFAAALKELYEGLDGVFDFIITDCPAGVGEGFRLAVGASDEAVVVTTPQLTSLRDADKVLSILRGAKLSSVKMVINRVRGDLVAGGAMLSPEEIEKTLRAPLLGVVPDDDGVFLNNAGLIPPEAASYRAFKLLANNLLSGKRKIYDCTSKYGGFIGYLRRKIKNGL